MKSAPHSNPLNAALELARKAGIKRGKVARALLACRKYHDWSFDEPGANEDVLQMLARRTNIVVQCTKHGAWVAVLDRKGGA